MNYECKTIPGYEDYQVDTNGSVYSLKFGKRKKLKAGLDGRGYLVINLWENGKAKNFKIHRLIMLSFHGESNLQVNHIDGVKTNNNLTNLEYCTQAENIRHAYKTGLACNKGVNNNSAKLTEKDVMEIKAALLAPYIGINKDLGRKYAVNPATIRSIKSGRSWKHVKLN
jgi:hypothetical protein